MGGGGGWWWLIGLVFLIALIALIALVVLIVVHVAHDSDLRFGAGSIPAFLRVVHQQESAITAARHATDRATCLNGGQVRGWPILDRDVRRGGSRSGCPLEMGVAR